MKRDWVVALLVFAVALAVRVPVRSAYAYHWDSAQFALAIEHYDLRQGLPHAPGFFLYIVLGRLVNLFVGDPHASLVWISMGAGAAVAGLGYLLATAMFGRRCGVVAATMLTTSALTWFHSAVALTTIVDCALVMATALVAWRATQTGGGWGSAAGLGALLAVVAGVRGQTVPGLLPVWLYAFARMKERRAAKLAVGVGVAGAVGVAWFWPLLVTSGGWTGFLAALAAQSRAATRYQVWTQGWPALATSGYIAAGAMVIGLGLAGAMAVAEWRRRDGAGHPEARRFLWWWIGPMVVMGMVVFYTILPGYLLCYFPAVAIAVAAAVVRAAERLRLRLAVVVGVVALANGALFLSDWRWPQLELNAPALRRHDAELARLFAEVRRRYRPEEVVLAHENQWFAFGFRHFQYHLPEYETWLLARDPVLAAPYDRRLWRARHRRVEFVEELAPVGRRVVRFTPPASLTETNCARPVRVP